MDTYIFMGKNKVGKIRENGNVHEVYVQLNKKKLWVSGKHKWERTNLIWSIRKKKYLWLSDLECRIIFQST